MPGNLRGCPGGVCKRGREDMNTNQIEYFLTLSELLSFTKAAEVLNISQPVLSRSIRSLEAALEVELFYRTTKTVSLTPAGTLLAEGLADLEQRYSSLLESVRSVQNGYAGELRLGVVNGMSLLDVREYLSDFQQAHPEIKCVFLSRNLSELRKLLTDQTLDFAVGLGCDFDYIPQFSCRAIREVPLCAVVSERHPLAARSGGFLRFSELEGETLIVIPESESPSVHALLRSIPGRGFQPKIVEVPDLPGVLLWADAGLGVALLPEASVSYGNPHLRFFRLTECAPMALSFIWYAENANPLVRTFIRFLQSTPPKPPEPSP